MTARKSHSVLSLPLWQRIATARWRGLVVAGAGGIVMLATGFLYPKLAVLAQVSQTVICSGTEITVPNATYDPVPVGEQYGVPGDCIAPNKIVLHTTDDPNNLTAKSIRDYFASGAGVDTHFIVGPDGAIEQTVKLYDKVVMVAYGVANYRDHISIEMVNPTEFKSKADVPAPEYAATYNLVKFLMTQYNIPLSTNDCHWKTASDAFDPNVPRGVYGHLQLNPQTKLDPGEQMLCDIIDDLKNNTGPNANTTAGGASSVTSGAAGRLVPYDAYARPYSWPMTGTILQPYGFTSEAQNLGARYPDLYPKGDPGVVFSTTNHTEPPPNAKNDKYINPNIDIAPNNLTASARAVYSTHAGWITYADWAGEGKGYTIQIESDVEGDGQADLATRYMHLQAPDGGFFAPDIAVFHPSSGSTNENGGTSNGTCSDPANNDWAPVNKWDSQILGGIAEITKVEGTAPECNLVKSFMKQESGGDPNALSPQGYVGLMQVADSSVAGGGSNCDWQKYNIHDPQGNINCGVQEITRGYKSCNNSWDAAIRKYFTGSCTGGGTDATGTSADQYVSSVKANWNYLNSVASTTPPPNVPPPSSQAASGTDSASAATAAANAAAAQIPPPYLLEAESMQKSSDKLTTMPDQTASNGQMVKFSQNGALAIPTKQKADRLVIMARGDQCTAFPGSDGSPEMVVKEDGTELKKFPVSSTTDWGTYTLDAVDGVKFDGGQHTLSIEYDNDLATGVCDRNLYVDVTKFYVLNPNTPTTQVLSSQTIEVENLTKLSGATDKVSVRDDATASNKKYVLFEANAKAEGTVTVKDPQANWIIVRAKGDQCQGAPHMSVKMDGQEIFGVDVSSDDWVDYSTSFKMPTGGEGANANQHTISVEFTNDKYVALVCDRNLYADVITLQQITTTQTTTNPNSLIGKTKYVGYNQLIGYVSSDRAHEKQGIDISKVPDANQSYLSYRIMYNNPNTTTFPLPDETDSFINARVDNPYIIETDDNTVAGSLKTVIDNPAAPMYFFCAYRTRGNAVRCIYAPNPI